MLAKDNVTYTLLQLPRDAPTRTSLGSMAIAFSLVLTIASDDLIAPMLVRGKLNAAIVHRRWPPAAPTSELSDHPAA